MKFEKFQGVGRGYVRVVDVVSVMVIIFSGRGKVIQFFQGG